jgi:hypothetical protein
MTPKIRSAKRAVWCPAWQSAAVVHFGVQVPLPRHTAVLPQLPTPWQLCAQVPALVHADTVYKTIDPDGRVIYSQNPPADGKVSKELSFASLPATPLPEWSE